MSWVKFDNLGKTCKFKPNLNFYWLAKIRVKFDNSIKV